MIKPISIYTAILLFFVIPITASSKSLYFDFGPEKQNVKQGFTGISGNTVYNPDKPNSFGWDKKWGHNFTRKSQDDVLIQDGITAIRHDYKPERKITFRADIPDGVYKVTVFTGDPARNEGRKGICVAVNGKVVIAPPGIGGWGTVVSREVPAIVDNGRLDVTFFVSGQGGANRLSLLGLTIESVQDKNLKKRFIEQLENAADINDLKQRTIEINGKKYVETGRRKEVVLRKLPPKYSGRNLLYFTRRNPGDILDYSIPKIKDITESITAFAAEDDDQPLYFGIYALKNLEDIRLYCTDLISPSGTLYKENIEIFTVTCLPQSPTIVPGSTVQIAPELLEKNIPFTLNKNHTQPVFLRIHVPENQPPGIYSGKFATCAAGLNPIELTLKLRVLPLKLLKPSDKVWHLYSDSGRWFRMSRREMFNEIKDMYRHGINSLKLGYPPVYGAYIEKNGKLVDADYGQLGEGMRYAAKLGMNGPLICSSTPGVLGRFRGWNINLKNGASYQFIKTGKSRAIEITHTNNNSRTELKQGTGTIFPPNEPVRLEINYKIEGKLSANMRIYFMRSYKRYPVKEGLVNKPLLANGAWQSTYVTTTVPADAIYAVPQFNISGGPGRIIIDEIKLLGRDGYVNHVINPGFERDFGPVDINKPWPEKFMNDYVDALRSIGKSAERMGFTPYIEGTDEAGNNPEREVKEISELKAARKTGYKVWCNLAPHLVEKTGKYLDGICFYDQFLGGEAGAAKLIEAEHKAGRKLYFISAGTYPGQDYCMLDNRFGVGFFFWKNDCDGTGIWTFQRVAGDPFNDLDANYKDCCLVYPPRKEGQAPVPTIAWEGIREGWKDYRYVYTLEHAIKQAEKQGEKEKVDKAKTVLNFIRKTIPWSDRRTKLNFDNYSADTLRWLAAWATMELSESGSKTQANEKVNEKEQLEIKCDFERKRKIQNKKPIYCTSINGKPSFDGRLNDRIWKDVSKIENFYNYKNPGVQAKQPTELYFCHDKTNLYLGFRCYENAMDQLKITAKTHDSNIFADDSIEMFLNTSNDELSYYQLCFNADGTKFDQYCFGGYNYGDSMFAVDYDKKKIRDVSWNGDWQVKTTKSKDYWEAEVIIPFKTVGRESDIWGIHIGRNRRVNPGETSSLEAIGLFNQPEKFSKLLLTGSRIGNTVLTRWDMPPTLCGINSTELSFKGNTTLNGKTILYEQSTNKTIPAVTDKNLNIRFPYRLGPLCKKLVLKVLGESDQELFVFAVPTHVPKALSIISGQQVFIPGSMQGTINVNTLISEQERQNHQLACFIENNNKMIALCKSKINGMHGKIEVDMENASNNFYSLTIQITDQKKNVFAQIKLPLVVAPNYMD